MEALRRFLLSDQVSGLYSHTSDSVSKGLQSVEKSA